VLADRKCVGKSSLFRFWKFSVVLALFGQLVSREVFWSKINGNNFGSSFSTNKIYFKLFSNLKNTKVMLLKSSDYSVCKLFHNTNSTISQIPLPISSQLFVQMAVIKSMLHSNKYPPGSNKISGMV
jgi:hypothetical protein